MHSIQKGWNFYMKLFEKESLKKSVIFFLILSILFLLIQIPFYSARKYGYQYKTVYQKVETFKKYESQQLDILYLGDSVGWAAFSPRTLWNNSGFTSYNLCTSGQWLEDASAILSMIGERMPKVLVIEGSMLFEHPNQIKNLFYKNFPLFHYHDYFRYTREVKLFENETKGYNDSNVVQPFNNGNDYMQHVNKNDVIKDDSKYYLDEILEKCKKFNTEVIVVTVPNGKGWNQSKHNYLTSYCETKGLPFIDFNMLLDNIHFDWQTDTRDGGEHLNNSGSVKVMEYLSKYLHDNYQLKDKHDNTDFQAWNELFERDK